MKKIGFVLVALVVFALLSMGLTTVYWSEPEYAKKFNGYRSLTGVDTVVGTACDTIITNIHNCFENYYAPADTNASPVRTVWCVAIYADAPDDSVDWDLDLAFSYDLVHWNFRGVIGPYDISGDSLILYSITKDADMMEYMRLIRTGGADNDISSGSIGEILLLWQNRGAKLGNGIGAEH